MTERKAVTPRGILITGASSGIGAALARAYAGPGVVLAISGRHRQRLAASAEVCRRRGAEVIAETVDVRDRDAMAGWIAALDASHPLELVIANAGISAGTAGGGDGDELTREVFAVNLAGMLNTVLPAIPPMRARGRGQIAIMSSLAGFRGMPSAPAYSASKAALKAYGEALRVRLAGDGVRVSVICPGFVDSRITALNQFPMPFFLDADKAARIIKRGLAGNRARIAFPWPLVWAMWGLAVLPPWLADPLLSRLPDKE